MDIEFHYYQTYLVAAYTGFSCSDAYIIAYGAQAVDDNGVHFKIKGDDGTTYKNHISQSFNMFKSKKYLMDINPLFHFIPGDTDKNLDNRVDGARHIMNTTPNSKNANKIIQDALNSKNIYRISIATHAYVDTWAHQNFTAYYDKFNSSSGWWQWLMPNHGHADFLLKPDYPCAFWQDERLVHSTIDNKKRFLEAIKELFKKFALYNNLENYHQKQQELIDIFNQVMIHRDDSDKNKDSRINRYIELSKLDKFGGKELKKYVYDEWFNDAIEEKKSFLRDNSKLNNVIDIIIFRDKLTFKDNYKNSHWYKYQEAVKEHKIYAKKVLDYIY